MRDLRFVLVWVPLLSAVHACNRPGAPQREARPESARRETKPASAPEPASAGATAAETSPLRGDVRVAALGKPAPDFELPDVDGKAVRLSAMRGKVVVLEWFNPECPFVNAAHTKGSLNGLAATHEKNGVEWLAVNSGAPGKQGHGVDKNNAGKAKFGLTHPILLDETGAVGRAYGAARTPHLFVVDAQGVLAYAGAIDNSPDGERESPADGRLINYVDEALADLAAGRPVRTSSTRAYGCSVKYGG